MIEHSTKKTATAQAHQLKCFWWDRGVMIKTKVIKIETETKRPVFSVRSNLGTVMGGV